MAAYKEFSYYYDSLMDPDFYSEYLKFIHEHANLKTRMWNWINCY